MGFFAGVWKRDGRKMRMDGELMDLLRESGKGRGWTAMLYRFVIFIIKLCRQVVISVIHILNLYTKSDIFHLTLRTSPPNPLIRPTKCQHHTFDDDDCCVVFPLLTVNSTSPTSSLLLRPNMANHLPHGSSMAMAQKTKTRAVSGSVTAQ